MLAETMRADLITVKRYIIMVHKLVPHIHKYPAHDPHVIKTIRARNQRT